MGGGECMEVPRMSEATLKKSLFPLQRVAKIVASRAAAKSFLFLKTILFLLFS